MTAVDYKDKEVYIGLDTHLRSWDVRILSEHTTGKNLHLSPPSVEKLVSYLHKHYPGANYNCAYEAGFCGFGVQRQLSTHNIKTLVIHAADVPTTDKEKRFKSDKMDSLKLAKALRGGFLTGIHVPEHQRELDRSVIRHRYRCAKDHRRIKHRIKSHLNYFGVCLAWTQDKKRYWSRRMVEQIQAYALEHKDDALCAMVDQLQQYRRIELAAMKKIRALAQQDRYQKKVGYLSSIKGIGPLTAMRILTELGPIDRFENNDHLAAYVGLIPGSQASGELNKSTRMSHRGNKRVRTALIQSAWVTIEHDSELSACYTSYKRRMCAQKAIIKIARKLLNRVRHVLKNKCDLAY